MKKIQNKVSISKYLEWLTEYQTSGINSQCTCERSRMNRPLRHIYNNLRNIERLKIKFCTKRERSKTRGGKSWLGLFFTAASATVLLRDTALHATLLFTSPLFIVYCKQIVSRQRGLDTSDWRTCEGRCPACSCEKTPFFGRVRLTRKEKIQ